jgi:hypothetical protein
LTNVEVENSKDFIILEAHNEIKKSYHLVMPHFVCTNHQQMFEFVKNVVSSVEQNYREMIDMSIYKKIHFFRMPLCSKATDETRIFKFVNEDFDIGYKYEDIYAVSARPAKWSDEQWDKFYNKELWMRALVSCEDSINQTVLSYPNLDTRDIRETHKEYSGIPDKYKHLKDVINKQLPDGVEIQNWIDYPDNRLIINCVNVSGYQCVYCNRVHEKENPFLYFNKSNNQLKFNCRRRLSENDELVDSLQI